MSLREIKSQSLVAIASLVISFAGILFFAGRWAGRIQTTLEKVSEEVGVLRADVGVLRADVGALRADVGTLRADVGALDGRVSRLEQQVTYLQLLHDPRSIPEIFENTEDQDILVRVLEAATQEPAANSLSVDEILSRLGDATSNDDEAATRALMVAAQNSEWAQRALLSIPQTLRDSQDSPIRR